MSLLTAVFYPFFLGILTLHALLQNTPVKDRFFLYCALAFPLGAGLCSLILFFSYLIVPSQAKFVSLSVSVAAAAALLGYSLSRAPKECPACAAPLSFFAKIQKFDLKNKRVFFPILLNAGSLILFASAFLAIVQFYSLAAPSNFLGGWDARFFWALKSKFFFRVPMEWQGMFSPKLFWSHPDYPLLLPGITAWGWNWLGQESLLWSAVVPMGFYLSCGLLLVWYLKAYVSAFTGWLAGTFFLTLEPYLFWSLQQYADVPLAFFIAACVLTLAAAMRSGRHEFLLLSGLTGGLAAWTKNEGLFFLAEAILLLGICLAFNYRKNFREIRTASFWFLGGVFFPLLAEIILKVFLGTTTEYIGPQRTLEGYARLVFGGWDRTLVILKAYVVYMGSFASWKGTWILCALAAVILGLRKRAEDRYAWILFAAVFLTYTGYFLTLHLTAYEIHFQIKTAFGRLLLHAGLLAVAFSFEALTLVLPKKEGQTAL